MKFECFRSLTFERMLVIDEDLREFEFSGSSDTPILRRQWDGASYYEILGHEPSEIDLARADNGSLPLLWGHSMDERDHKGAIIQAKISQGRTMCRARLNPGDDHAHTWAGLKAGTIRNVSVRYDVAAYEVIDDGAEVKTVRITRWTPLEFSLVSVPVDHTVGTGRDVSFSPISIPEAQKMPVSPVVASPEPLVSAPISAPILAVTPSRAWVDEALSLAEKHPTVTVTQSRSLINESTDLGTFQANLLRHLAAVQVPMPAALPSVSIGLDQRDHAQNGLELALLCRVDTRAKPDENSRPYRGLHLADICRRAMIELGGRTERSLAGMTRNEIAGEFIAMTSRMHSTSDFPFLLGNVANKRLQRNYVESVPSYTQWAYRAPDLVDFKPVTVANSSEMPDLLLLPEGADVKYASVGENAEVYKLLTYARAIKLTRQAIVNDDLRTFDNALMKFATAARRLENRIVYGQLLDNPVMADGIALFHASHGNLAGTGSVISTASLDAARKSMRDQKGLVATPGEAAPILNIAPRFLLVGTAYEGLAYTNTSVSTVPSSPSQVNEYGPGGRSSLTPIVEPIITGNQWFLVADSSQQATVEYAYLEGQDGVVVEQNIEFSSDAVSIKARLDFAAKAADWRGVTKNAGA